MDTEINNSPLLLQNPMRPLLLFALDVNFSNLFFAAESQFCFRIQYGTKRPKRFINTFNFRPISRSLMKHTPVYTSRLASRCLWIEEDMQLKVYKSTLSMPLLSSDQPVSQTQRKETSINMNLHAKIIL